MMIFGLLLTGCGSQTDVLEPNPNQQEIEQKNTEQTMEDENKDSQDTVDDINVSLLSLQKETICYEEWGNLGVICQAARDVIHLEDETKKAYPELSKALDDLRSEKIEEMDTFMSNFLNRHRKRMESEMIFMAIRANVSFLSKGQIIRFLVLGKPIMNIPVAHVR